MGIHPSRPKHGLSLCAGGGGLDVGLMLAEPVFHTRCFVEWEEYPRDCLIAAQRAGYFAPAPIWTDLRTFDARPWAGRIDTLLAGYPCQPFSAAGKRLGEDDERHLWPEVARCARELGPGLEWVFLENVAGHVTLGLETVLRELRDMGFTPAAGLFSAGETGATHERLRIFIVAHRPRERAGEQDDPISAEPRDDAWRGFGRGSLRFYGELGNAARLGRGEGRPEPELRGGRDATACAGRAMAAPDNDYDARGVDGRGFTGAPAGGQGRDEGQGRASHGQRLRPQLGCSGHNLANACRAGLEGREQPRSPDERFGSTAHGPVAERGRPRVHAPGPADMAGWLDALSVAPWLAPAASFGDLARLASQASAMAQAGLVAEAEVEPALCRMADGLAHRARALRLLGNGVHPLAAGHAWRSLAVAHGLGAVDLGAE